MATPLWGIDLGGTKIEGVILESVEKPNVLARLRIPTESAKGYQHIISQVATLVQMLGAQTNLKPSTLGIGTPGTLDPVTQHLKNSNTVCLNGMPFKKIWNKPCKSQSVSPTMPIVLLWQKQRWGLYRK